jgi:hypothetical protein
MHEPQYVELSDIPVQIPDDYTDSEKQDALEVAEAEAELDLNDGKELHGVPDELEPKIRTAIKQLATAELIKSSESPSDVTLRDLGNDGATKRDFAEQYSEQYETLIARFGQYALDQR